MARWTGSQPAVSRSRSRSAASGLGGPRQRWLLPSGDGCARGSLQPCSALPSFPRWLTQKGARQKKINEWLGIKNETEE